MKTIVSHSEKPEFTGKEAIGIFDSQTSSEVLRHDTFILERAPANIFDIILGRLSRLDRLGITLIRLAIAIVFLWIGTLKFVPYEADSITPFVANSPVMSFFYENPEDYKQHLTHEGELNPAKRAWQTQNHTYSFSSGLGVVEWIIGLLVLSNFLSRRLGLIGGLLSLATTVVTLSFLITTPEAWVAPLGDANYGFPYLSGAGRLVLKDTLMLAGAVVIIADSARTLSKRRQLKI